MSGSAQVSTSDIRAFREQGILKIDFAELIGAEAFAGLVTALSDAEDKPASIQSAVEPSGETPALTPATATAPDAEQAVPAPPVDGLRISSQSWRRGGLGSKALITFTLRNANDYAVKDIEIACAFARRDGSHLTDRKRVLGEAVEMKSRKTFTRVHVGFVNVNADKAKCALVAANRI